MAVTNVPTNSPMAQKKFASKKQIPQPKKPVKTPKK